MKKLYFLASLLMSGFAFAQQTLPYTDSFSYAAGNLHETAPWTALGSVSTTGDHIVLDGSKVTFAGGGTDAQLTITSQSSGTLFYKLDLNITSMAGVTDANGGYIAGFSQNATTFGGTLWAKRVDDTTYNLGIETRTATGTSTTYTTATYNTGTIYSIIVAYTFNTGATNDDTCRLWVNSTSASDESSPLLTDTHTGTDLNPIVSFFLRQDSTTETGTVEVDNLKITTTFADLLSTNSMEISGLQVYTNNNLLFVTSDSSSDKNVVVYDMLGKVVVNETVSSQPINVANLSSGAYIVKVTEEGKTATKKLVIQ